MLFKLWDYFLFCFDWVVLVWLWRYCYECFWNCLVLVSDWLRYWLGMMGLEEFLLIGLFLGGVFEFWEMFCLLLFFYYVDRVY